MAVSYSNTFVFCTFTTKNQLLFFYIIQELAFILSMSKHSDKITLDILFPDCQDRHRSSNTAGKKSIL